MSAASVPRRILPVIAVSQFAGTSLWFAINAVMPDLQRETGWPESAVGALTVAVQLGFIAGTLGFALLAVEVLGSVLTFVNCIGFSISVATIALFASLAAAWPLAQVLPGLALGPALGLWWLWPLARRRA